ncbi:hypothetical protein H4S02_001379 [Coemansia sp. RSA 2611]|uniref:Elongation factor P n=2 Tax=Coemansia TaxID=4863 RepID=A0A9W8L3C6_9FUNG|nr:hypothetical protein LPJ60_002604 [Coemansia sp. RSA 2675]KAJ2013134.1 hypothetical protein GGI06_003917 [Coemansia sp. S85]KAJ2391348.1 hypothetical protein H4S02_001379 [Coemansia sp. RSA 2611]KAJ2687833.1 hypothetical protein IWW39_002647 [Coemansia spiralis]KAJ2697692.1 hypothetical protein H4218_003786 [Coemansia sp. IMI 209128]KAJ2788395.1 hypothetical protein GGI18_002974 [Coemansia linderi]
MLRSIIPRLTTRCPAHVLSTQQRWYKVGPNAARLGMVIDHNGSPLIVVGKDHGGTGRGQAVIKLTFKNAITGAKSQDRFRANDSLEVMLMVQKEYQYLYKDTEKIHLMDMTSYEELSMDLESFEGDKERLAMLEDGMNITVQTLEPEPGPISWRLPARHVFKVKSVEARIVKDKGATYLPAVLENNARVMVPDFIKPGESVTVDLEKAEYVGRA